MSIPLEVRGLSSGYGELAVIHDLDLELHEGEVVALFGPNGAGKSTTLLTLAGQLEPLGGSVLWFGDQLAGAVYQRAKRGLGFVPEQRSVLMSMTVRDNLRLGSGGADRAVAIFPELKPLLGRRAGLLSGGEQQMLSLGRALATAPRVLLIDELSLGLAPLIVERLLEAIQQTARYSGVAVLMVEQQARRALHVADRWYLMRRGSIVATGNSESGTDELEAAYLASAELT